MSRRNTLSDVAKRAGVGKVTVSYVLNGRASEARISAQTAERIMAAARDLDYRPNALARMLLRKRTETIAVVFQYADYFRASSTFTSEVMRGVCDGSVANGVDVLLHTKASVDPVAEADALTDGRVDGALVLRDAEDPMLALVLARKFPVVLFFCRSDNPDVPFVDLDNFMGGKIATNHLLDLGHRRIAMVRGSLGSVASNDRHSGYRHALEGRGIAYDPSLVVPGLLGNANHKPLLDLMRGPDRPTALFVWSDDDAFSCMRVVSELGLSIPNDISVVGFDSSPACDQFNPPLTSVRQPVAEMARQATEILVDIVNGTATPDRLRVVFPPSLDVRGSTAAPL
ncbi:MAG: LacI family DNA-binding transcriptional regulator [Fimbriimonas sp.]